MSKNVRNSAGGFWENNNGEIRFNLDKNYNF